NLQRLADPRLDFLAALLGRREPLLGPGAILARGRKGYDGVARRLVELALARLRLGQAGVRRPPRSLGFGDLVVQGAQPRLELFGSVGQPGELIGKLGPSGAESGDLPLAI